MDFIVALLGNFSRTKVNGRLGLLSDVIVGLGLVWVAKRGYDVGALASLATIASGLILFSFIEYAFHRWLFHGEFEIPKRGHWQHHLQPLGDDSLPFFVPPIGMIAIGCALASVVPTGIALLFVGGIAIGYAMYGLSHIIIHSVRFRRAFPRRWAASHHIHHAHPEKNFGVTTPLWDFIFGTRYVPARSVAYGDNAPQ